MATVELVSTRGRTPAVTATRAQSRDTLADQFLTVAAIGGAVLGAVAGSALGTVAETAGAVTCGMLGVVTCSGVAAVFGRYALFPVWMALFPAD